VGYLAGMIGMRSGPGCCAPQVVPAGNSVGVSPADASVCLCGDTTRPHGTNPAAKTFVAKLAVWGLFDLAIRPGLSAAGFAGQVV
jgi:hypothetical protein